MKAFSKIVTFSLFILVSFSSYAYEFTGFYIFGDSLSSNRVWNGWAPGRMGTGNNWHYYFRQSFPSTFCENYAAGGWETPTILDSVNRFVNANSASLNPEGLYCIWGGTNDDHTYAGNVILAVDSLYNAGARKIIVANLYANPYKSSAFVTGFNADLKNGLSNVAADVIQMDVFSLVNEIVRNPSIYGLNGSGIFTDNLHPSDTVHRIIGDYFSSVLLAPALMVTLPEIPLSSARIHYDTLESSLDVIHSQPFSTNELLFNAQITSNGFTLDETDTSYEADTNSFSFSGGLHYAFLPDLLGGLGISSLNTDVDFSQNMGDATLSSVFYSAYLSYEYKKFLFKLFFSGGSLSYDIDRIIKLDTATRTETSDPGGSYSSYKISFSRKFTLKNNLTLIPFVSYNIQNVEVDDFSESGNNSTAMIFTSQERDSTLCCLGSYIAYPKEIEIGKMLFFGKIYYESEQESDQGRIRASVKNLSGTSFEELGIEPESNALNFLAGIKVEFPNKIAAVVTYHSRSGSDSSEYSINAGIQYRFHENLV